MSSGPVRRVLPKDIQLVQNLIERCLQLYMNQKEVVETLLAQAKIEPGFTELVWQKLEKENQDFFRAYYMRLMVKHQIIKFNKLLEHQVRLMQHQMQPAGVASLPTSNGSHIPQLHHNSALYATEQAGSSLKQENVQHDIGSRLPNVFTNGGSSLRTNMHDVIDMSAHASIIDVPHNLLPTQSSNIGLIQGLNGGMIENETGYYGSSPYMFDADGHVLEARPPIRDTSVASFSSVGSSTRSLNETLFNGDSASFGYFDQIPRIFSFSDLTADFSQSADILESYSRSPFLAANTENFLDSHEGEHQGDNKRLDTISEGLSYEDFGSD